MNKVDFYDTPVGKIGICSNGNAITHIFSGTAAPDGYLVGETALIKEAARQIGAYFAGRRKQFDLPVEEEGTQFEKNIWKTLRSIPYGKTWSYGEVAAAVGKPGAYRAAGRACGRNPLLIVTPCHRVIGTDGSLTGFAAGIEMKRFLLSLERKDM